MRYILCATLLLLFGSMSAQLPSGGLVAHYPFNNDAADKSGNNNNGTVTGGVNAAEDRFGNPCGALRFNGTDGFIAVPNSSGLKSPSASISIITWFRIEKNKTGSGDINFALLSKSAQGAKAQYRFTLSRAFGDSRSNISLSSDLAIQDDNYNAHAIEFDQWYFLAIVYEESWVNIFLNDKLIAQSIVKKPFTPNDFNLEIGRDITGAPKFFSGCLDDLRIYNRGLSPMEVTSLFNYQSAKGTMENLSVNFPADIEKNTDAGKCYTTVSFTEPTASSGCGKVELKQVSGLPSGSLFGAGQNIITYEATLPSGKKLIDTFQIIVTDKEPPVIKCADNITVTAEAGSKGAAVDYALPTATDNCQNTDIDLLSGPASGTIFTEGTTTVRYTATDVSGNTGECSFKVTVIKNIPRTLHCPQDIVAYSKANTENAIVNYTAPYVDVSGVKTVMKRTKGFSSGSLFPIGKTEVAYELADTVHGNMVCNFSISVRDTTAPVIDCPADVKVTCEAGQKSVVVNYGLPKASDSGYGISVQLVSGYITGSQFPVGVTVVKFEAGDESDNKSGCSFKVIVEEKKAIAPKPVEQAKAAIKEIKAPEVKKVPPVINETEEKIIQPQKPFVPPVTEQKPKVKVEEKPVVTVNSANKNKVLEAEKAFFPDDAIPKEATIKPAEKPAIIIHAEDESEQPKEVTKPAPIVAEKKEEKPVETARPKPSPPTRPIVIECNEDIFKHADPGKCGTVITYDAPAIRSGDGVNITQIKGNASGTFFKSGTTLNTFSASDGSRIKECSFRVTVKEDEPPVFNCPSDTTILLPINRRGIVYYYNDPSVKDNCGVDSLILETGSKNGCFLEVGVHPFIYKAIDVSGNYQICTHSVIIRTGAPAITVEPPKNIDAQLNLGSDSVHYEYRAETNNCFLTIFIYDDGEEDNDTVSIIYNGQVIVNRDMIRVKENKMIKRSLVLDGGNENYIIAKAWNKGKYGLNTLRIDVYEGNIENEKRELKDRKPVISKVLHSKPGTAGGMILRCKE